MERKNNNSLLDFFLILILKVNLFNLLFLPSVILGFTSNSYAFGLKAMVFESESPLEAKKERDLAFVEESEKGRNLALAEVEKERTLAFKRLKGYEDYIGAYKTYFYSANLIDNLLTTLLETISAPEVPDSEKFSEFKKYYSQKDLDYFIQKKLHLKKLHKKTLMKFIVQNDITNIRNEIVISDLKSAEKVLEDFQNFRKEFVNHHSAITRHPGLLENPTWTTEKYASFLESQEYKIHSRFEDARRTYNSTLELIPMPEFSDRNRNGHLFTFSYALQQMRFDIYLILHRERLVALNEGFDLNRSEEIRDLPPNFVNISPQLTVAELASIAQTKLIVDITDKKRSKLRKRRIKKSLCRFLH